MTSMALMNEYKLAAMSAMKSSTSSTVTPPQSQSQKRWGGTWRRSVDPSCAEIGG